MPALLARLVRSLGSTIGLGLVIAAVALSGTGVAVTRTLVHHDTSVSKHRAGVRPVLVPVDVRTQGTSRSQQRPRAVPKPVAPLRHLYTPDVLIELGFSATQKQIDALRHGAGVQAVAVLDAGKIRTPLANLYAVGVEPSVFRQFTPRLTAQSDALWQAVARGELAASNTYAEDMRARFGKTITAASGHQRQLRLGAFASFGVAGVDAVVDRDTADWLGMLPARRLVVAAPRLSLDQLRALSAQVLGSQAHVELLRPAAVDQSRISAYAARVIPASYLRLYRSAASTCPGLPWTVLAAIGAVETGHGADTSVSSAGAMGPMQFLPSTWRYYGMDANGDGVADINNPDDAVYSAARYLCASGAGRGGQALYDAIFAYNHADWYVRAVLKLALLYQ